MGGPATIFAATQDKSDYEDDDGHMTKKGRAVSTAFDPMDITGSRASDTQDALMDILRENANKALESSKRRYKRVKKLQKPFIKYGKKALADKDSKEFGVQYQQEFKEGSKALKRSLAARGMSKSSYAGNKFVDMAVQAADRELARQHQNRLSGIKIGQLASGTAGRGGAQLAQSAGAIASMQGQGAQNVFNAFGQQRQASLNSFGNAAQNMGTYFDQQGGY